MKNLLPLLLLLASYASAQSTVTLSNLQLGTRISPSLCTGSSSAKGSDGLIYSWNCSGIWTYVSTGTLLATCTVPYTGTFQFFDTTPTDTAPNTTRKGPYLCDNGQVIGLLVKYSTTYSARTHATSYYVTSGTATIQ